MPPAPPFPRTPRPRWPLPTLVISGVVAVLGTILAFTEGGRTLDATGMVVDPDWSSVSTSVPVNTRERGRSASSVTVTGRIRPRPPEG